MFGMKSVIHSQTSISNFIPRFIKVIYNHLSIFGLKLNHGSKWGPRMFLKTNTVHTQKYGEMGA